ncbi:hypothetical protein [Nocardioides sp.]|uniref:hypothetical protein n=1 Tax=Nocardioides sp. TaxID=35761 RepID=UPI0035126C24
MRRVRALDRAALAVVALGLLAAAGGLWWWRREGADRVLDPTPVTDASRESWWPWALGAVGVVLLVLGLGWLWAHLRPRPVPVVRLAGSGREGRLLLEPAAAADAAAHALADTLGVRRAGARVSRERGGLLLRVRALVDPDADPRVVADAAARVRADAAGVVGRDDVDLRVELRVARRTRGVSRVR